MRRDSWIVVAFAFAIAGCGPSKDERAKAQEAKAIAAIAERRDAVLAQLTLVAELGGSAEPIPQGDTLPGVRADFRDTIASSRNRVCNALLLRDEQVAELQYQLKNK